MGGASAKRALVVLLLGATAAILIAGCSGGSGGGSNNAAEQSFSTYETSMQALGRTLGAAITASGNANISATPAAIARNLRRVQVELRTAAVKLEKITPPAQVRAQHELLTKGVREFADELDGVIAQAKSGNQRQALGSIVTLKGIKDMSRASQAIAKAGFVIVTPP
jgi:hypothetical protein